MMKFRGIHGSMIELEISFLRTYLEEMEKTLKEKEVDLRQAWKELENEDDSHDHEEYLIDCNYELEKQFGYFYSSFIMVIFSFLEGKLNDMCKIFSITHKEVKIRLKDLNGRGIQRARLFMEKVCDFTLPDERLWENLKGIESVRNCFVHSGGETNDEKVINYAKKAGKIKIEEKPYLKITIIKATKDYCSYVIDTIEDYLLAITDINKDKL